MLRGTATYATAAVLQRAIPFLLLPLFVRFLTPAEFGEIGILTTLATAAGVLLSFGLETTIFRSYLLARGDAEARRALLGTVGGFAIIVPLAISGVFIAFGAPALAPTLGLPTAALQLAAAGAAVNAGATSVPLALLRADERLGAYLQLTGLQAISTALLTILFVVVLGWGPVGWMLAYAVASATLLLRGLAIYRSAWSPSLDTQRLRRALAFGLPLVPHAASHWALAVSDRAILGAFVPAAEVGAYYVAFLLCLPISTVATAMSQATQPLFSEAATSTEARSEVTRASTAHAGLVGWTGAAVVLLGPPLIHLAFPPDYWRAAEFIPWQALGLSLFGLYLLPMNAISLTAGRTKRVWMITLLAAIANVGLNLLLIPRIGTIAAAINTTIGYAILLVGVFLYSRAVCKPPISYELIRILMSLLVVGILCLAGMLLIPFDAGGGLALRAGVLLVVSGALAFSGLLGQRARLALGLLRAVGSRADR